MNRKQLQASSAAASLAAAFLFAGVQSAWADVKIVAQQTTRGLPSGAAAAAIASGKNENAPQITKNGDAVEMKDVTTTFYKGEKQRVESKRAVVITDYAAGTVITLNPTAKTYHMVKLSEVGAGIADNPMMNMFKVTGTADVTPGGETRTIAGKAAKNYKYTIKINMTAGEGTDPALAAAIPNIGTTIVGEQWTTDALSLPLNAVSASRTAMIKNLPASMSKGMKLVGDKMSSIPGVPLSSVVSVKVEMPKEFLAMIQSQGAGAAVPIEPIVTTTEVTSISEEPLDDALFSAPADYKKVNAPKPTTPGFPGAGVGGV